MHGDRRQIRPCRHAGNRQVFSKIQMGAVRFVHQHLHPPFMGHLRDLFQIGTDPVIGWIIDEHRLRVRICIHHPAHLFYLYPQSNADPGIHLRLHIDRNRAAQHQSVDHAFMYISGQDDLIPRLAHGQNHALHRTGSPIHHQERMGRAERICGQFLRPADHRHRMSQIVQRFHGIHIQADTFLSKKLCQFRIPPASFMSRHVEGHYPSSPEFFQRLVDRGGFLIIQIHLHSLCLFRTKKGNLRTTVHLLPLSKISYIFRF